jgi:hypothetical protein
MLSRLSSGERHRSAAQTVTPNSRAKKMEDELVPQPRSRTRMPGFNSTFRLMSSASHSGLGPIACEYAHTGSYADARGNDRTLIVASKR